MHTKPNNPGYILILTLMLISLMVALVTQIFLRGQTYLTYSRAVESRERAYLLALSGVEIALQQLFVEKADSRAGIQTGLEAPPAKDDADADKKPQGRMELSLNKLFPLMNQWQTFDLKKEIDGSDGQILLYISSEDGKLNINEFYDFDTKKFKETQKTKGAVRQALIDAFNSLITASGGEGAADEIVSSLEEWLKKQTSPINDVTQLLEVEGMSRIIPDIYQRPDPEKKLSGQVALTDVFTVSSPMSLDMWLLSRSWAQALGLEGAAQKDKESRTELIKDLAKKATASMQWPAAWDKLFKPVYEVGWDKIPKGIQPLLATQYIPRVFSVIAYGMVGRTSQKLFAIVERQGSALVGEAYAIKKIYMI